MLRCGLRPEAAFCGHAPVESSRRLLQISVMGPAECCHLDGSRTEQHALFEQSQDTTAQTWTARGRKRGTCAAQGQVLWKSGSLNITCKWSVGHHVASICLPPWRASSHSFGVVPQILLSE